MSEQAEWGYWHWWARHPLRMIWAGWEIRGWVGLGPFEKRRPRHPRLPLPTQHQRGRGAGMSERSWLAGIGFRLLDIANTLHRERCDKWGGWYGGENDDRVRLCSKLRWHWDSHTYEPFPSTNEGSEG